MDQHKKKINAKNAVAAVTGAIVGAGIGAVATKSLSDKKTRKKITESFSGVRKQIIDSLDTTTDKVEEKKEGIKGEIKKDKTVKAS